MEMFDLRVNSYGGLMNTRGDYSVEKYTLPKFRHAEEETNAMRCRDTNSKTESLMECGRY